MRVPSVRVTTRLPESTLGGRRDAEVERQRRRSAGTPRRRRWPARRRAAGAGCRGRTVSARDGGVVDGRREELGVRRLPEPGLDGRRRRAARGRAEVAEHALGAAAQVFGRAGGCIAAGAGRRCTPLSAGSHDAATGRRRIVTRVPAIATLTPRPVTRAARACHAPVSIDDLVDRGGVQPRARRHLERGRAVAEMLVDADGDGHAVGGRRDERRGGLGGGGNGQRGQGSEHDSTHRAQGTAWGDAQTSVTSDR